MEPGLAAFFGALPGALAAIVVGFLAHRAGRAARAALEQGGGGPRATVALEGASHVSVHQTQGPGDTGRFAAASGCPCSAEIAALREHVDGRLDALKSEALDRLDEANKGWRDDTRGLALAVAALPPELRAIAKSVDQNSELTRDAVRSKRGGS